MIRARALTDTDRKNDQRVSVNERLDGVNDDGYPEACLIQFVVERWCSSQHINMALPRPVANESVRKRRYIMVRRMIKQHPIIPSGTAYNGEMM